ncbi:hypothetical protein ACP4OV_014845 [Aristida adscensionis]
MLLPSCRPCTPPPFQDSVGGDPKAVVTTARPLLLHRPRYHLLRCTISCGAPPMASPSKGDGHSVKRIHCVGNWGSPWPPPPLPSSTLRVSSCSPSSSPPPLTPARQKPKASTLCSRRARPSAAAAPTSTSTSACRRWAPTAEAAAPGATGSCPPSAVDLVTANATSTAAKIDGLLTPGGSGGGDDGGGDATARCLRSCRALYGGIVRRQPGCAAAVNAGEFDEANRSLEASASAARECEDGFGESGVASPVEEDDCAFKLAKLAVALLALAH